MQGRTQGGADLATVKREFVRVTGLPVSVADEMFGGMPKVIKRKALKADAERIAATLRAIGAVTTIEREVGNVDDDDAPDEGIEIIAAPMGNGPPTVIPGSAPAEPAPAAKPARAWLRQAREKGPLVAGTLALLGAGLYFAPEVSGWVESLRPAPPSVAKAAPRPTPEAVADESPTSGLNVALVHGPWRCVDQRTGLGVYWNYSADGALSFHGEVLSDRPAAGSEAPNAWQIEGGKLLHKHADGDIDAYVVSALSLSRLGYAGERGLEIECRRP